MGEPLEITLRTLTPLWTGGAGMSHDRLHETGILGSLRWWCEALVRGLGGAACDPTESGVRCPDDDGRRCAVCELFGCTGWQRKFKLRFLGEQPPASVTSAIGLGSGRTMTWQFFELRGIAPDEWWLLYQALRIAAEWGAIGGRTPRKPQANQKVGGDYGLIAILGCRRPPDVGREHVRAHLQDSRFRRPTDAAWPDLRNFFFVRGAFLWRREINALLGKSDDGRRNVSNGPLEIALRGCKGGPGVAAQSKRIFSFKTPPGRLWGYLPDPHLRDMAIERVKGLLQGRARRLEVRTVEEVVHGL